MKPHRSFLALAVFLALSTTLLACPDRTIGTKIDDALDNRPMEKLQDKTEDVADSVKDATN